MTEVVHQVSVAAPVDVTWAAFTDWERQHEWMLGTEVHVVRGDGASAGSRLVAFTGVAGVGFLDRMEITAWEPPHRCAVRHTGRLVRGTGLFEAERAPGGSVFRWTERLDLPFGVLGQLGWRLARPAFDYGLRRSLAAFAHFARGYGR